MEYSEDVIRKVVKNWRHCWSLDTADRDTEGFILKGNHNFRKLQTRDQLETCIKFQAISKKRAELSMSSKDN